jgi:hypothetical protein
MKTADLIAKLAGDALPVPPGVLARRLAPPILVGAVAAAVIVVLWLGLRDLVAAAATFAFWMKGGYTSLLALGGLMILGRLSRPGGAVGPGRWIIIVAFAMMLGLAAAEYLALPPYYRTPAWLGGSWSWCPFRILALSAPVFIGVLLGMRRLAPTRLTLAGAAAGFVAGAIGATVYQLFCPETGAMFVTTWYSLGVLASTGLGALLGRSLLRW